MSNSTWTFCDGTITVVDTGDDYRATLTDQSGFHDSRGQTIAEAIGGLILRHEKALVAVIRATKAPSMTHAEAVALAATISATPGYIVLYASERVDGWVVVVQALDPRRHADTTFTVHSRAEWTRQRDAVNVQPRLMPEPDSVRHVHVD